MDKWPIAADEDRVFAEAARHVTSTTVITHIRFASTGAVELKNTHPSEQRGRLFAHNGVVEDLDLLDAELGGHRGLVAGDTDSERVFALVTKRTSRHPCAGTCSEAKRSRSELMSTVTRI